MAMQTSHTFDNIAGKAPYSRVITHGFVLDEKDLKMSKSLGSVVDPRAIIEGGKNQEEAPSYGADVLRLWVSSVDYTGDVLIGPQAENAIEYDELLEIDQHALFQLESVVKNIKESYESYQFFKILSKFLYRQLSLLKFLNNPHSSSHRSPKKLPRNMNFRLDRGRLYTS
uniref:Putative leucine-tRNA ligase, archaeal n=1 Tax=Helianthus annuus TaxID=4232 RepID=A0A251SUR3_HELAN